MCLINGTKPDVRKNLATWIKLVDSAATAGVGGIFLEHAELVDLARRS